jgi:diguanylate cyclase (GGDEF)-like protein
VSAGAFASDKGRLSIAVPGHTTGHMRIQAACVMWLMLAAVLSAEVFALAPERAFHHYVKDSWSIEEGLPQITVNSVVQGPDGYIWAATQAGLARFDGVRFTNFAPADTPQLQGIFLRSLFVDSAQRVWIGSYRGATVYQRGNFRAVDDGFGREFDVFGFAETGEGHVLVATASGLLQFEDDVLVHGPGYPNESLSSVFHHEGETLAGGRGEIFRKDGDGWHRMALPDDLAAAQVVDFAWHDGVVWAASSRGLLVFEDEEWRRFELPGLPRDLVTEMLYRDQDGNFWIGAAGVLIRLRGRELVQVIDDDAPYAHPGVLAATEDHEGNLWLGGRWSGLARLWNGWVLLYDKPEGLHNSLVWSVARDGDGNLWTGTMDGLAVLRDGRFEQVTEGIEQPHPHAYTLLPEDDRVWVGTRSGLFLWNRQAQRIEWPEAFSALNGVQVNGIVPYRGAYWLATFDGVWRWDGREMRRMAERDAPGGKDIRLLFETAEGELLAGTRRGLLRLAGDSFETVPGVAEGHDITSILQRADGGLVLGTIDERLWFEINGEWHEFGTADGLPPNNAYALAEYEGRIWVAGIRGIHELALDSVFDYLAGRGDALATRMVLNERGDVPGAQKGYCCNGAGNAKGFMADGELWLPTRGGVLNLAPDDIVRNPEPPQVRIDRIRYGGEWHELASGQVPALNPEHRDLAFGIGVLSFQHPDSVQIKYRLVGFDDRWQRLDAPMQRQVTYTNLPAGELRLEVKATNNAGIWSQQPVELVVAIPPRIWETTGFRALLLFVAVLAVWLFSNLRMRKLQSQQLDLERMVAERTEELRVANENLQDYGSRMDMVSMSDSLTDCWNRRYLHSQLPSDLAHFHRELARGTGEIRAMLFALIDIDQFRRVNERFGHGAGDAVLCQLAERLRVFVRRGDYVVRWSGEQFLVVFRPMALTEFEQVAERMMAMVRERPFEVGGGAPIELTCSFGMASYPPYLDQPGALTWEDTVALAEKALLHVKGRGRDGWCLVSPTPWVEPATLLRRLDERLATLVAERLLSIAACSDD